MKNTFTDPLLKRPPISRNLRALIMRISQVYILILTTAIMSVAKPGSGQSIETTEVKLEIQNEPLTKVFSEIEKQTDFLFSWAPGKVQGLGRVSIAHGKYTVKEALEMVLRGRDLKYRQQQNYILVLSKNETEYEKASDNSLEDQIDDIRNSLFIITGTVKDASMQEPLAGVNIIVKGTTSGTTTDVEGKFKIECTANDILVFSFIGFQTLELQVNDQTTLDIAMTSDVTALKEVVVNAGYWNVKERENTGNIAKVTSEVLNKQPVSNPLAALMGRIPGVAVTQVTGIPGDGFKLEIRGINSVRGTSANEPLYVVDGVPFSSTTMSFPSTTSIVAPSPLNSINPGDIESIEVLKDADATAIYGSRGANGVVLITTKKGSAGNAKLDFNIYSGVAYVPHFLDLLNTQQYVEMRKEAFRNDGISPSVSNAQDLLLWDTTKYTNWQKLLIGNTGKVLNVQSSVSGGTNTTNFIFSQSFNRQTTVFPADFAYQKGSSHLNLIHMSLTKKLKINLTANYVVEGNNVPVADLTSMAVTLAPNAPEVYNENGELNWENGTWTNPIAGMRRQYQGRTNNLIGSANINLEVLKGLSLRANLGYNSLNMREKYLSTISSQNPSTNPQGFAIHSNGSTSAYTIEPQSEYEKSFGKGKFSILVGMTIQESIREKNGIFASGYTTDSQLENLSAAPSLRISDAEYSQYRYLATFGRFNFSYGDRYIVNLTGRKDGSSRFGPENQFANFGAVGVAWIFSNEKIISSGLKVLSFGKIRTSYGSTGSDRIGDYQFLDTHSSTNNNYEGGKGLIPTRLVNPDFAWEVNRKFETALDLGFLNDRIFTSLSYYNNRSSNQLVGYTLPFITGFSSIQANLPATVRNTGFEFQLSTINIQKRNFRWSTALNFTFPRNTLVDYPNIDGSAYSNTYKVGEPLSILKKYRSLGVDQQTGLYAFEDVDNDGTLSTTIDTQFSKAISAEYFGGFENSISYGSFEFLFFFQFVKQTGQSYLATTSSPPGFSKVNQTKEVLKRWQNPGDITNIQKYTQGASLGPYINARTFGDGIVTDASFIRLKNVSLSYKLSDSLAEKIGCSRVKAYFQGQNILTLTDYFGLDPETQSVQRLPPLRVLTFGIQAGI